MSLERIRYEIKIMGRWAVLAPIVTVAVFILLAILLAYMHTDARRFLLAVPEMLLPLLAGVVVGAVITQDQALELHLTMPHKYHLTGMLRFVLMAGCIALMAFTFINVMWMNNLLFFLPLHVFTDWSPFVQFMAVQGIWLPPLLWCLAVGFCFALILQGWTGNVALLGGIWVAEIIFKDWIALSDWLRPVLLFPTTLLLFSATDKAPPAQALEFFNKYWLTTRLELLVAAVVLIPLGWLLLRNTERMLKGTTTE